MRGACQDRALCKLARNSEAGITERRRGKMCLFAAVLFVRRFVLDYLPARMVVLPPTRVAEAGLRSRSRSEVGALSAPKRAK